MEKDQSLTSVKIFSNKWDDFKIACIKYKFSFFKLSNACISLYLKDEEFRKKIHEEFRNLEKEN